MNINIHNYEVYLLQYMEEMLSPQEREEVELFLAQHPDIEAEMRRFYDPTLVVTPPSVVAPHKETLKRKPLFPLWRYVAAACVVAAAVIALLPYLTHKSTVVEQPHLAEVHPQPAAPQPQPAPLTATTASTPTPRKATPHPTPPTISVDSVVYNQPLQQETFIAEVTPEIDPATPAYTIATEPEIIAPDLPLAYDTTPHYDTIEVYNLITYNYDPIATLESLANPYRNYLEMKVYSLENTLLAYIDRIKSFSR